MLEPVLVTPPTVTPVSLADAKAQCHVDSTDDDALLTTLIESVVSDLDGYNGTQGRALITQTWRQDFADFNCELRLPVGDVIAITSIYYYDADNVLTELNPDIYDFFTDEMGSYIGLLPDEEWPATSTQPDAVIVTWTAGYGPAGSDVPANIRQSILIKVEMLFDALRGTGDFERAEYMEKASNRLAFSRRRLTC